MIGNPGGGTALMAIYANSGGMPTLLLGQSGTATIGSGVNILPVSMTLSANSYWLMAEFTATSTICDDGGSSNTLIFGAASFGAASLPTNFQNVAGGPSTLSNNVVYNFFVVSAD
jgi:hypothetical protein